MSAHQLRERIRVAHCAGLAALVALTLLLRVTPSRADGPDKSPTLRHAIKFLTHEVPDWPRQHGCCSCHNNGDGARALLVARRHGWDVPDAALVDTRQWLLTPERWQQSGGNSDYNDKRLIVVQFASALANVVADDSAEAAAAAALQSAARDLAGLQFPDGSWAFEADGQVGSPIGYGRPLMTVVARNTLKSADPRKFAAQIDRANSWLLAFEPRTVLDSAAAILGLADSPDSDAATRIKSPLEIIKRGQSPRGGWGPYEIAPPEPFDTAIVLLALSRLEQNETNREMIAAGRRFLETTQLPDGAWPATTRPSGIESYQQKMSTTAWATIALLETDG